jgi:peptidoglycan/xylan/chitin deacetylase (PgdA/CDA1 family)
MPKIVHEEMQHPLTGGHPLRDTRMRDALTPGRVSTARDHRASGRFACLTYHRVGQEEDQYTVGEDQLRFQLGFLRAQGYAACDFEDLEVHLTAGSEFPVRYVVLTADDGHVSSLQFADLCEAYTCRATLFVTRDRSLFRPGFMGDAEIRALRRRGFSFGTHGTSHRKLTFISKSDCRQELEASKSWLEDVLGEEVRWMAAPGGYINRRVERMAREIGYTLIGTCRELMNSPQALALSGLVNRTSVRRHFSRDAFLHAVEGDARFYLARQLRAAALMIPKQILR